MARFKVKKKKNPTEELKQEVKRINWRLHIAVAVSTLIIFGIYQLCVLLAFGPIMYIYIGAATVLFVAYYLVNGGFSGRQITPDELPPDWDEELRHSYACRLNRRRKKAKLLMIPLIGILFTLAFDIVYLFYLEPII